MLKYIGLLFAFMIASGAEAGSLFEGKSEKELSNYEIQVVDKTTGKVVGKMTRATHKVVSLESSNDLAMNMMQFQYETQIEQMRQLAGAHFEYGKSVEEKNHRNTVILHAGVGKDGLDRGNNGYAWEVSERNAGVLGATYCRSENHRGLCGTGFTNKTFTLGLKFDF